MTKAQIIEIARQAGACTNALDVVSQKDTTWKNLEPAWAYWLRVRCDDQLDTYTKARADVVVCRNVTWAYNLRLDCRTLSARTKRRIVKLMHNYPGVACALRINVNDLSRYEKRQYEGIVRQSPKAAFRLVTECHDLSIHARRKLEAVVRKDAELADNLRHLKQRARELGISVPEYAAYHDQV